MLMISKYAFKQSHVNVARMKIFNGNLEFQFKIKLSVTTTKPELLLCSSTIGNHENFLEHESLTYQPAWMMYNSDYGRHIFLFRCFTEAIWFAALCLDEHITSASMKRQTVGATCNDEIHQPEKRFM